MIRRFPTVWHTHVLACASPNIETHSCAHSLFGNTILQNRSTWQECKTWKEGKPFQKHVVELASATGNWWFILLGPSGHLRANRKACPQWLPPPSARRWPLEYYGPHISRSKCEWLSNTFVEWKSPREEARGISLGQRQKAGGGRGRGVCCWPVLAVLIWAKPAGHRSPTAAVARIKK